MDKPETFQEVREFLSSFHAIHGGGCGIAALAMYRWLYKHNKVPDHFKFVACYEKHQGDEYVNNMKVLRTGDGKAVACSHVAIYYDSIVIDCREDVCLHRYDLIQFIGPTWFIVNMVNNVRTWNSWFDRDNIHIIEEVLDISLSDMVNEQ